MKIENHFKITIDDREAEKIITVDDIYEIVKKQVGAKSALQQLETEKVINEIIADHTGIDLKDIEPHKSLTSDLGLD